MKKKIEAELRELAKKILNQDFNTESLKQETLKLYEKLTLLSFTEKHFLEEESQKTPPVAKAPKPVTEPAESVQDTETRWRNDEFAPDGTEYRDEEAITEPATEKIKDIVAQMPPETEDIDRLVEQVKTPVKKEEVREKKEVKERTEVEKPKNDFRNIGVDYDNLPSFEPLNNRQKEQRPTSLNDRLKKGINIGLNERLSYIKHLFDGNTADYNRVLSQLNTLDSLEDARKFIEKIVKPDYNHWEGKEAYEARFMEKIENKFEA